MDEAAFEKYSKISETKLFLRYLNPFDMDKLDLILDDQISYFGTTKTIFLERLRYIFEQNRHAPNYREPVIKRSKKHSNLYKLKFEGMYVTVKFFIDEKNGRIQRMYNRSAVRNRKDADLNTPFDLVFGDDEKPGFVPSVDYLVAEHECKLACQEFAPTLQKAFTSAEINDWLQRNRQLYDYARTNYMYFKLFYFEKLYWDIEFKISHLIHLPEVLEALNSFDDSTVESIYNWLMKYDTLAYCNVLCFDRYFTKYDFQNQQFRYGYCEDIYFSGDDFGAIIRFCKLYDKHDYPARMHQYQQIIAEQGSDPDLVG
jgi:hypothetical protein